MTTPFRRVMEEKRRLIWPLVIALALNAVLFALVEYPLSRKVASGEQDAAAAETALLTAKRDYANARQTVTGKTQADAELAKFYKDVLPPDLSGARRITYLRIPQLAQRTNLRLETQSSAPSEVKGGELGKLTQQAVLKGDYRDIRRFIHQLETAPEFLVLEHVELTQNENDADKGITVTIQVATYFRAGGNGN
jgi:Tfp pilus assembly protein PilO